MTGNIPDQPDLIPREPSQTYEQATTGPSGVSIAAFVLGILSIVTCGPCFSIPALVLGLIEMRNIKNRASSEEGHAFALTGAILGGISLGLGLLIAVFYLFMIAIAIFAGAAGSV